jgi:hypothetical protein
LICFEELREVIEDFGDMGIAVHDLVVYGYGPGIGQW